MSDSDDDTDDTEDYSTPAMDPFLTAIALCQIAERAKPIATALKKLRKVGQDILSAEKKLAAVAAAAEQTNVELAARATALDERERVLDARETRFESSLTDARDELREHHARLDETHRQLIHRIMSTTGMLGEWNPNLQPLPTWQQLRGMIADLPAPATEPAMRIDAFSDVSDNPLADRHGNAFLGSLSRSTDHKRGTA
jgi:hypothetical protein